MENEGKPSIDKIGCMYDSLTGIYNLDTFKEEVSKFLKLQEEESKFALLYTDITHLNGLIICMEPTRRMRF